MRVFLDANVLFSAAKSDGAIRDLLSRLRRADHEVVADAYVAAEARRNLEAYGQQALQALDALLESIEVATYRHASLPRELAGMLPAKDRPVLAAAIRLGCNSLVTGDRKHFGALFGTVQHGVAIHSPRSLAESLSL